MKELIIVAAITACLLYVFRQKNIPFNPFRQYIYHFRSHADGGCKREEAYLRESNGIILKEDGLVPWFTNGQLFDRNKFWLCPIGGSFTFSFHTSSFNGTMVQVNHFYKAVMEGEYVKIVWAGQSDEWFPIRTYKLFKVPENWVYRPAPRSGQAGNSFFSDSMEPGDTISISVSMPQLTR